MSVNRRQMYVQELNSILKSIEKKCYSCDVSSMNECKTCTKLVELEKQRDIIQEKLNKWNYSS